jgi:hypothetical protein
MLCNPHALYCKLPSRVCRWPLPEMAKMILKRGFLKIVLATLLLVAQ